ncbi:MAG: sensor histidine kinase [Chthoniobacterales bacterium]
MQEAQLTSARRILDDILDFSRIESGRPALEQQILSQNDLIETIKLLFTRQINEKGLELKVVIDPALPDAVEGDPGRIRQILVNLVGNAFKFTKTGSIEIQTSEARGDADSRSLEFVVHDTGPGISPDRAHTIFGAFVQKDSSISRRLAELMDGTLRLSSEVGEGTAFTLQIPLRLAR